MPNLRSHHWSISYSSNENNPIADFYIPALECAIADKQIATKHQFMFKNLPDFPPLKSKAVSICNSLKSDNIPFILLPNLQFLNLQFD